ncbi:hypothetical protein PFISCL1PPCAC_416, partial [Pristionchus fissidentatus]
IKCDSKSGFYIKCETCNVYCEDPNKLTKESAEHAKKVVQDEEDKKQKVTLGLGIGGGLIALIVIVICVYCCLKKKKNKNYDRKDEGVAPTQNDAETSASLSNRNK